MPEIPEEAIQAATRALMDHYKGPETSSYQIATIALEAAAPFLAAEPESWRESDEQQSRCPGQDRCTGYNCPLASHQ